MINRRSFIKSAALLASAAAFAPRAFSIQEKKYGENLRMAFIGTGGRGWSNMRDFYKIKQIPVALCDVESNRLKHAKENLAPEAATFKDYREMLDKMHSQIDAVVISTPDVSHYAAAMCAIKYGLPIYIEKPLCHTIGQIRSLYKAASEKNIIAQMGNQSHSTEGIRYCKEWIDGGLIGKVKEVVLWTDRPLGTGVADFPNNIKQYPSAKPVPAVLDWDLWQNVAEPQPYFGNGVEYEKWRGWWKYGSGSLGDIGCHMLDIPVYALGLSYPSRIKSTTRGVTEISVASQEKVEYFFDKSNQGVPVKVTWYSGFKYPNKEDGSYPKDYDKSLLPPLPKEWTDVGRGYRELSDNGQFIIGEKGVIYAGAMHLGGRPALLPRDLWESVKNNLPRTEPRVKHNHHWLNFVEAVKGEAKLSSPLDYAHVLTEVVQLGNLASRTGADIVWDSKNLVCKGNPKATAFVNPPMPKGWF